MSQPYTQAVYSGASGAVTTTAALATTYTGLVLTNPVGSPVLLVLQAVGWAPLVAQAGAITLGLMGGSSASAVTQTTPVTPVCNYLGSPAGFGLLASSATLPAAPKLMHVLGSLLTGAITTVPAAGSCLNIDNGLPLIVLPPGTYLAFYTSSASASSSLNFSLQWGEQPE